MNLHKILRIFKSIIDGTEALLFILEEELDETPYEFAQLAQLPEAHTEERNRFERCQYNARSPYLRCAVKPDGNCLSCKHFKEG